MHFHGITLKCNYLSICVKYTYLFAVPKEPLLSAQLCFDDEEEEKEVKKEPSRHAHSSPLRGPSLNPVALNSPNSFLGTDVMSSSPKAKSPHPASYEGEQGMYRHQQIRADFDVHFFFFFFFLNSIIDISFNSNNFDSIFENCWKHKINHFHIYTYITLISMFSSIKK